MVTASATDFTDATDTIVVHDGDLDHYAWDPISSPQIGMVAFPVMVRAENVDDETLPMYAGAANLSGAGSEGPVPVTPVSCSFASGIWADNVTVNAVATRVVLTVDDALGHTGSSNSFDVTHGPLDHFQWTVIASPQYKDLPFTTTLTAMDAHGFTVTDFHGSVDLSGWMGGHANLPPPGPPIGSGNVKLLGTDLMLGINADGSLIVQDLSLGANFLGNEFLVPGSPQASFSLAVEGVSYHNNAPADGTTIPMTVTDISAGGVLHAQAVGDQSGIHIVRDIWFHPGDHVAAFQVTLQNTTGTTLNNVAWLENFDPDQGYGLNSNFSTSNDVLLDGHYAEAVYYYSPTYPGGLTIGIGSNDMRAVASAEGFDVVDPFDVINTPEDPNGGTGDIASNLAFNVGALAPGASTTLNYSMVFAADRQAAADLFQAQINTPVPINPTTATFTNGVWTGEVTVLQEAENMFLHMDDFAGHVRDSNTFNVLPLT